MILYFCRKPGCHVLTAQLPTLSNINNEFVGYGLSSMKDEEQIHTGRPFGGVAILSKKNT